MNKIKGITLAMFSSALFGLIPFFSVPLLRQGMHVCSILAYRYLICAVVIALFCLIAKKSFRVSRRVLLSTFAMGFLYSGTNVALITSYHYIPTSLSTTVYFLYPIAVAILMVLFFHERSSLRLLLAILLSVGGVALFCRPEGQTVDMKGVAIVSISIVMYALYILLINKTVEKDSVSKEVLVFYVTLFGSLMLFVFSYFTDGIDRVPLGRLWINLVGLGVACTVIPAIAFYYAIRNAGAVISSILGSMEPFLAMLVGIFYFSEPYSWSTFLGFILIIVAVVLVVTSKRSAKPSYFLKLSKHGDRK